MPTKFLEGFTGKLAEQWVATLLTPAFAFWVGGFFAWLHRFGWNELQASFTSLVEPLQIAVLIGILLIITTSAFAIQRFDLAVLRFFEGYWYPWLNPIRRRLIKRQRQRFDRLDRQWQNLKQSEDHLTPEQRDDLTTIDYQLRQFPDRSDRLMPTRLGNILRSAESKPSDKYGLDAVICWSRLWLVLPEGVRRELQDARADLNTAARTWLWGILFLIWSVWALWAIPVGLIVAWFAYGWMLDAATTYGDLLESAFDLYRIDLYRSLHLPLPQSPAQERQLGQFVTEYLWRGSDRAKPEFVYGDENGKTNDK
ncbi:hypothetical protein [Leptolyngbya ohadii]|uniref:hypothetical protein n=1 Tax=Leptolyngbya ohadii TaxID=1962290 RepID=UPI000B5A0B36|nr:hypothetical protein [Leptolyngbya ohadii]